MIIKTAELEGAALDWAVAKSAHSVWYNKDGEFGQATGWLVSIKVKNDAINVRLGDYHPSIAWMQGGPLIEEYSVGFCPMKDEILASTVISQERGTTHLIAAMRAIVASKLGEGVDIPDDLVK